MYVSIESYGCCRRLCVTTHSRTVAPACVQQLAPHLLPALPWPPGQPAAPTQPGDQRTHLCNHCATRLLECCYNVARMLLQIYYCNVATSRPPDWAPVPSPPPKTRGGRRRCLWALEVPRHSCSRGAVSEATIALKVGTHWNLIGTHMNYHLHWTSETLRSSACC